MPEASYDDVPYPGYAFASTHPDSLATVAHLHGLDVPHAAQSRVIEFGCGNGGNLIPIASAFPAARLFGIDVAPGAIAHGRAEAASLGLTNIEFAVGDIATFTSAHRFDFVIAHGVYSWVPEPVRRRLLALYGELLSERGLGFLSFAAYPGGHLTAMLHHMAKFHARDAADARAAIAAARDLLRMVAAAATASDPAQASLRRDALRMADFDDALIAHDVLSDTHHCAWLHDIAAQLRELGLQYVADARLTPQVAISGLPHVERFVALGGDDAVLRAQYLDFVRVNRFREIVIARAGTKPALAPRADRLDPVRLRADIAPEGATPSLAPGAAVRFNVRTGSGLTIDDPLAKAALLAIAAAYPRGLLLGEIVAASVGALRAAGFDSAMPADPAAHLAEALSALLGGDLLQPALNEPPMPRAPGERPRTAPIARRQFAHDRRTVNLRHEAVEIDEQGRRLALLMDGTRDRDALAAALELPRARIDEMIAIIHRSGLLIED